MKTVKRLIIVTLAVLSLTSCSRVGYADNVACSDIGKDTLDTLDDNLEYAEFDEAHVELYFDDTNEYDDYYTVYSTDTNNINEIGIFHASNKDNAEDLADECRDYIEDMQENSRAFIQSYAPEELPKLDGAQVRRFGNYVVYTVLDSDKANAVFESIKENLKK